MSQLYNKRRSRTRNSW